MNTTVKHTPGPWQVDADQRADEKTRQLAARYGLKESRGTAIIGDIKQWEHNESYSVVAVVNDDNWECEANARLIAAAPELLEALRGIRDMRIGDPEKVVDAAFAKADAAIAKAEGHQ